MHVRAQMCVVCMPRTNGNVSYMHAYKVPTYIKTHVHAYIYVCIDHMHKQIYTCSPAHAESFMEDKKTISLLRKRTRTMFLNKTD